MADFRKEMVTERCRWCEGGPIGSVCVCDKRVKVISISLAIYKSGALRCSGMKGELHNVEGILSVYGG